MWIMLALLLLFRCQIALPVSDDDEQLGRQLRCLECKVHLSWGPQFKWSQLFCTYKYWENTWSAADIGNASWWSLCTRHLCCVCRGFLVALTFGRKHFARCEKYGSNGTKGELLWWKLQSNMNDELVWSELTPKTYLLNQAQPFFYLTFINLAQIVTVAKVSLHFYLMALTWWTAENCGKWVDWWFMEIKVIC